MTFHKALLLTSSKYLRIFRYFNSAHIFKDFITGMVAIVNRSITMTFSNEISLICKSLVILHYTSPGLMFKNMWLHDYM
jgi:hypothetical protein